MKELKTYQDCLEAVKPIWLDYDGISIRTIPKKDKVDKLPTERQAWQIINLKKMMTIAKAVGMVEYYMWQCIRSASLVHDPSDEFNNNEMRQFIRICQDPDGDGDESKNLFEPFKPEAK